MKIGGHPIDHEVDMAADYSVVTQPVGPLSKRHITIIRATRNWTCHPFLVSRQCNLESSEVRHEFLYLPNCPVGLMGRNLFMQTEDTENF
jgi:hypothetical protein